MFYVVFVLANYLLINYILCFMFFTEILCFDKDPVTFNYDDVAFNKRRMFFVFYVIPISFLFFVIMFLTIYSIHRLRIMMQKGGNKSMIRLLQRLIPLSSVFFIAFTPTAVFFLRGYVTENEDYTNKTIAILGQVLSGTLYALCYAYFCYVDFTYVSAATKRILEIEEANDSYEQRATMDSERISNVSVGLDNQPSNPSPPGSSNGGSSNGMMKNNRNTFEISPSNVKKEQETTMVSTSSSAVQNPMSSSHSSAQI